MAEIKSELRKRLEAMAKEKRTSYIYDSWGKPFRKVDYPFSEGQAFDFHTNTITFDTPENNIEFLNMMVYGQRKAKETLVQVLKDNAFKTRMK